MALIIFLWARHRACTLHSTGTEARVIRHTYSRINAPPSKNYSYLPSPTLPIIGFLSTILSNINSDANCRLLGHQVTVDFEPKHSITATRTRADARQGTYSGPILTYEVIGDAIASSETIPSPITAFSSLPWAVRSLYQKNYRQSGPNERESFCSPVITAQDLAARRPLISIN